MFTIRIINHGYGPLVPQEDVYEADYYQLSVQKDGYDLILYPTPRNLPSVPMKICFSDEIIIENATGKTVELLRRDPVSPEGKLTIWRRGHGNRVFEMPKADVAA